VPQKKACGYVYLGNNLNASKGRQAPPKPTPLPGAHPRPSLRECVSYALSARRPSLQDSFAWSTLLLRTPTLRSRSPRP